MKQCSKKREKSRIASEETGISLYCVLGKEYRGDAAFPANSSSPASSVSTGCCKYKAAAEVGGRRRRRSPDLKAVDDNDRCERFGREIFSTHAAGVNFSGESTSSIQISAEVMATEKPELAPAESVSAQREPPVLAAAKTPSAVELEEFFTEAEYVQKRFIEKYNYDIVKDAPILGGRYQWVRTHI